MRLRRPTAPAAESVRPAQGQWGVVARYLVCFAVLPNLPFWLLAKREGIASPGWFSFDGLCLGIVALYVKPSLLLPLFAADFLLDIADAICHTYGVGFVDVAHSAGYITKVLAHAQIGTIVGLVGLVLAVVGAAWVWLRPRAQGHERSHLAQVMLVGTLVWGGAAYLAAPHTLRARSLRSPVGDFALAWHREDIGDRLRGVGPDAMATAASAADQGGVLLHALPGKPNFVVVLVESWGEANAPALQQALLSPLETASVTQRYQLHSGRVHFNGPTGNGILRELCDLNRGVPDEGSPAPASLLQQCLPARLARRGYSTVAMDSVSAFWPGGSKFYQQFGVQTVVNYSDLTARGLTPFTAGPFRAIADTDTASQIPRLLLRGAGQPVFLFYLTVSAHLPVHLPLPGGYEADCGFAAATQQSAQACGWYRIERRTLAAIAAAATAPGLAPTVFVIVGDHAPPFVDGARDAFSAEDVPYAILAPRARSH